MRPRCESTNNGTRCVLDADPFPHAHHGTSEPDENGHVHRRLWSDGRMMTRGESEAYAAKRWAGEMGRRER